MRWLDTRALPALLFVLTVACGSGSRADPPTAPSPPTATPSPSPTGARRFDVTITGGDVAQGGILYRPEIADAARPALIVVHGWQTAGTNGAAVVEGRARRYAEDGYVALALSMRGWPPSGGTDDCGLRQPDDVVAALRWLATQPGVDPQRMGLVGFSQGGQVALLAGAHGAPVRAIAAFYPVTDVALWKTTTANVDIPAYIAAVCEPGGTALRSPRLQAASIAAPVLLVHGDEDTRVPTDQSRLMLSALQAAGRESMLLLVPGAVHGFTADQEAFARPIVDRFLADHLK